MVRGIIDEAKNLTFEHLVQEAVLGKIASDIYNEAKKIALLRHVGVRKSKLLSPRRNLRKKSQLAPVPALGQHHVQSKT
jgi:ribosomal protein S3AE